MPKRRYKKRTYNKKTYKVTPSTSIGPLRTVQRAKFIYQDNIVLNPGIGTFDQHVFSANGLFDPNVTGIGHQPRGFDELMQMYDHYLVTSCKMTIWINSSENGGNGNLLMVLSVRDNVSAITSQPDVLEYRYIKVAQTDSVSKQGGFLTITCRPGKFLGFTNMRNEKDLQGNVGANPTEGAFIYIHCGAVDGANDPGNVQAQVRIEYETLLMEPKKLLSS